MLKIVSKIIAWSLLSLILLLLAGIVIAVIVNFRMRSTAEALLRDVRALKVGESTTADIHRIVERYHGEKDGGWSGECPYSDESYDVDITNRYLLQTAIDLPFLRKFGVLPWMAGATFILENGRVCEVDYGLGIQSAAHTMLHGVMNLNFEGRMIPSWKKQLSDARRTPGIVAPPEHIEELLSRSDPHHFYYQVRRSYSQKFLNRRLEAEVQPDGPAEDRQRAFDFNLSCLTKIQGCRNACEIMPSAWKDWIIERRSQGESIPPDELNDPRCPRID